MWSYKNYNVISLCPWNILLQTSMNIMQTIEGNCVDEKCVIILGKINKRQLCMQDCNRRKTICFLFLWQQTYAHLISTCLFYFRFFCLNKADVWRHTLFNERWYKLISYVRSDSKYIHHKMKEKIFQDRSIKWMEDKETMWVHFNL